MVQKLVFLENRQNQTLKQTFFPRTLWGLEKLRKGPEHVLTPNRHMYVYSKAQVCVPKGTKNWEQNPILSGDDSQKPKKFKISKFSIVCLCVYILTMGRGMSSTDVLDPKEITKSFRDASRMFQRYFRKVGFGTLKTH